MGELFYTSSLDKCDRLTEICESLITQFGLFFNISSTYSSSPDLRNSGKF